MVAIQFTNRFFGFQPKVRECGQFLQNLRPELLGVFAAGVEVPCKLVEVASHLAALGRQDTRRTAVMQQALAHGYADIINDVSALGDEGAIGLLAQQAHTGICLMHMQGMPETMQQSPSYQDVAEEVLRYLNERVAACEAAGIARARLVLDPGFGFGKTLPHNIALMQHLGSLLRGSGLPLLIGVSRKRMIGDLSGEQDAAARVHGSVAAALAAVARGAQIVRVHDVKATADALKVWQAVGVFEAV